MWARPSQAEPLRMKERADSLLENTLYICSGRGRRKEGIEKGGRSSLTYSKLLVLALTTGETGGWTGQATLSLFACHMAESKSAMSRSMLATIPPTQEQALHTSFTVKPSHCEGTAPPVWVGKRHFHSPRRWQVSDPQHVQNKDSCPQTCLFSHIPILISGVPS